MIALATLLLLAAAEPVAVPAPKPNPLVEQLKADVVKTDRAITITEQQIARSRAAPYAPELQFRLAELYVEKSRYLYLLQRETVGAGQGSVVAPETRLVKQKAIDLYDRILRDTPDWAGCDRARFYLAHEYRELGQFDRMLELEEELAKLHPKSPLAAEALMIVGDHWFGASDLTRAEAAYQRVLALPPSPVQDLARFKMGWVRLNQSKHGEAVGYFEAAAASPTMDSASADVLSVKREALFDLVFSYTEARPSKGAVDYFEKLAGSHAVFLGVLEKLANRYFIKQEAEPAVAAYRRLLQISRNPDRDHEFAARLHDAIKVGGDKTPAKAGDVREIVRVAARARTDDRLSADERRTRLEELEIYARDLATGLLVAARKAAGADPSRKGGDRAVPNREAFAEAAEAHEAWLSLFRDSPQKLAMQRNLADALYAAERWHPAGRAFERVAADAAAPADQEEALYDALGAFSRAEQHPQELSPWQLVDARRAMGLLGADYVSRFPASPRVAQVKFNVARASYDDGDWKHASELFVAYCDEHPDSADTAAAANLALDALHVSGDYEALDQVGRQLTQNQKLPEALRRQLGEIVDAARKERLSAVALQSGARTGDAAVGLVDLADQKAGTELGEQALHAAFATYREKKNYVKVVEIGAKFLAAYPQSPRSADVLATQAKLSMDLADYDAAAVDYAALHDRFPDEPAGLEAAKTSATLRLMLGDPRSAVLGLEKVAPDKRAGAVGRLLAEARLSAGDAAGAETAAQVVLAANAADADAATWLGRAMLAERKVPEAARALQAALKAVRKSRVADDALARLWDVDGSAALQQMLALPADPLDPKVAALKGVQEASAAVAQLGAGDLAVEGLYRLAVGFDNLATALAGLPAPAKLSADDKAKFLGAVAQQAGQVRGQSQQAFDACTAKARELEVFAPFVAGCAARAPVAEPPAPSAVARPAAQTPGVVEARSALLKHGPEAGRLETLGLAQLAAADVRRARLTFQKSLEMADTRAPAHAALGVALARMGEYELARLAYRKALELDPTLDRAHAGMAALHCRFGDLEAGKAQLARMRAPVDPAAPDADPELAKCGGAK